MYTVCGGYGVDGVTNEVTWCGYNGVGCADYVILSGVFIAWVCYCSCNKGVMMMQYCNVCCGVDGVCCGMWW